MAVWIAVLKQIVKRIMTGPARPTWTWRTEIGCAALHAVLLKVAGSDDLNLDDLPQTDAGFVSPRLRRVVRLVHGRVGGVPGEWLRRDVPWRESSVTLLYLHGGAYIVGSPLGYRHLTSRIAWEARADLFVVDYRLAPEYPFPSSIDDCFSVYEGLLAEGTDPQDIVIIGDSAGGGLTMATMMRAVRAGVPLPAGAVCISPFLDLGFSGESIETNKRTDYLPLSYANVRSTVRNAYLGDHDFRDPLASPIYAETEELAQFPPILLCAGDAEAILDDSRRFRDHAEAAGVDVRLIEFPDMFHDWPMIAPSDPESLRALDAIDLFIAERMRDATRPDIRGVGRRAAPKPR